MTRRRGQSTKTKLRERKSPMDDAPRLQRFLEPVYLNEKMVLNCAAYLFKGVALQSETTETSDSSRGAAVSLGVPFLQNLLGAEGGIRSGSAQESRSARRYTSGGLHMAVLDELVERTMIRSSTADNISTSAGMGEAYVDIHTVLRPSDYYATIGTLKILGPLVSQVIRDFGDHMPALRSKFSETDEMRASVSEYERSIMSLIDKLEEDYLTSKQLEMIMWSKDGNGSPIGVVDLDVTDYEPSELRSKLSGGKYHVIGKVVGKVERGSRLDLMQKTILSKAADLVQRMLSMQQDQEMLRQYQTQITALRQMVEQLVLLDIPGPALRIAAMSVCI